MIEDRSCRTCSNFWTPLAKPPCDTCELPSRPNWALKDFIPPKKTAMANQVGGDHYKSMPIQTMEFSFRNKLNCCQHTAIKYICRYKEKGGAEDLNKAIHVLNMLKELEGYNK